MSITAVPARSGSVARASGSDRKEAADAKIKTLRIMRCMCITATELGYDLFNELDESLPVLRLGRFGLRSILKRPQLPPAEIDLG
jgi:hypothetical protein